MVPKTQYQVKCDGAAKLNVELSVCKADLDLLKGMLAATQDEEWRRQEMMSLHGREADRLGHDSVALQGELKHQSALLQAELKFAIPEKTRLALAI